MARRNTSRILTKRVGDKMRFRIRFSSVWTRIVGSTIAHHVESFDECADRELDFDVRFGGKIEVPEDCTDIDGTLVAKDTIAEINRSYKGARWSYSMSGLDSDKLVCDVSANALGYRYMAGTLVYLSFLLSSVRAGIPLVHASAIEIDERGTVISARGGAGKTTLAMKAVDRGSGRIVSDNYVFLDQGRALSYPAPLNLFSYNISDSVKRTLKQSTRLELMAKAALYRITLGKVKLFITPTMREILGDIVVPEARTSRLILLIPTRSIASAEESDIEYAADFITWNQRLENSLYERALAAHAYQFPQGALGTLWSRYRGLVKERLRGFEKITLMRIPEGPITNEIAEFVWRAMNAE